MCCNPLVLPNGSEVSCRKCWQCRATRVDDWVGRCIAEGEVSKAVNSVTLTYRDDGVRSSILTYSDIQRFLKRLRADGYPVRYLVAGEYGSRKGRAHWHAILFWRRRSPNYPFRVNFSQEHWPNGLSYWDESSVSALRYVCKYILKQEDGAADGMVRMSKAPPLGSEYFRKLAGDYVRAGLAPRDGSYSFPDVKGPDGVPLRFHLHRHSLDAFVMSFLIQWYLARGGHPPVSPFLEEWCDKNPQRALAISGRR